ncbi:MAG: histidine phosphatase family protein [Limnobacter sp.]|nr:histidine phosphatase family protein [Limnobacter sp.]
MKASTLLQRHAQLWESTPPSHRKVVLVRHGETDWNASKRFQGHTDIPLNPLGVQQALALAGHFRQLEEAIQRPIAQRCISSDLSRARDTAAILWDAQAKLHLEPKLRERDYGHLSGLTGDEMAAQHPEAFQGLKARAPHSPLPGGESLHDFNQRVLTAFVKLLSDYPDDDLLLVAHGGVLDCIYRYCTREPLEKHRDWLLPNAALNLLQVEKARSQAEETSATPPAAEILLWADQSHFVQQEDRPKDEVDGRIA